MTVSKRPLHSSLDNSKLRPGIPIDTVKSAAAPIMAFCLVVVVLVAIYFPALQHIAPRKLGLLSIFSSLKAKVAPLASIQGTLVTPIPNSDLKLWTIEVQDIKETMNITGATHWRITYQYKGSGRYKDVPFTAHALDDKGETGWTLEGLVDVLDDSSVIISDAQLFRQSTPTSNGNRIAAQYITESDESPFFQAVIERVERALQAYVNGRRTRSIIGAP